MAKKLITTKLEVFGRVIVYLRPGRPLSAVKIIRLTTASPVVVLLKDGRIAYGSTNPFERPEKYFPFSPCAIQIVESMQRMGVISMPDYYNYMEEAAKQRYERQRKENFDEAICAMRRADVPDHIIADFEREPWKHKTA